MKTVTVIDETPLPPIRHCERSEAIHRAQAEAWIASSRSLSSGARSRDPLAPRNDGCAKNIRLIDVNASAIIEL
jgi:hypothetical protein